MKNKGYIQALVSEVINSLHFERIGVLLCLFLLFPTLGVQAQSENVIDDATLTTDSLSEDSTIFVALPWPENVQARLDTLLTDRLFNTSQVALYVYDLTADSVIYAHNEQQTLRPASTQKLITSITAIDRLGGSYQFKTSLYYTGIISGSLLKGDLICVGGMDPRFGGDDMRAFCESVLKLGIDTICGNIIADESFKDRDRLGEGWCWDDDNPILSPLLINRKDNFTERLSRDLASAGICIITPDMAIDSLLSERLASIASNSSKRILCTRTHSIEQILNKMMKDSDNLYAESLFYQTGAAGGNRPSTAKSAAQVEKQLLRKIGLNPSRYRIADGSGLSLYNYTTAHVLVTMLRYAYHNSNIYELLYPSLPVAGIDGTIKSRMTGIHTRGNVHAKTGTLSCVSSLAGYLTANSGHQLAFAIINQGVMNGSEARKFQDKVCAALCCP